MPGQTSKSILAGKLPTGTLAKAHAAVKDDLPQVGGNMGLPAGIENGVAKLVLCAFGTYKPGTPHAGQPFFQAQGVVVHPEFLGGVKIAGERTRIFPEPICETPTAAGKRKTLADHWGHTCAILDNLGLKVSEITGSSDQEIEDKIKAGMDALVRTGVHFKFRTWAGSKTDVFKSPDGKWRLYEVNKDGSRGNQVTSSVGSWTSEEAARKANKYAGREPNVNETWGKATEWHAPEASANGAVVDETANGAAHEEAAAAEPEGEFNEFADGSAGEEAPDLAALVEAANAEDKDAQRALLAAAVAAGHSQEDAEAAENWEAVAEMAGTPPAEAEAEEEAAAEEEAPAIPAKGEVWLMAQVDAKGKPKVGSNKKPLKPLEVEVTAVNAANRTADCKNNSDKKTLYKAISFDHLTPMGS